MCSGGLQLVPFLKHWSFGFTVSLPKVPSHSKQLTWASAIDIAFLKQKSFPDKHIHDCVAVHWLLSLWVVGILLFRFRYHNPQAFLRLWNISTKNDLNPSNVLWFDIYESCAFKWCNSQGNQWNESGDISQSKTTVNFMRIAKNEKQTVKQRTVWLNFRSPLTVDCHRKTFDCFFFGLWV